MSGSGKAERRKEKAEHRPAWHSSDLPWQSGEAIGSAEETQRMAVAEVRRRKWQK